MTLVRRIAVARDMGPLETGELSAQVVGREAR